MQVESVLVILKPTVNGRLVLCGKCQTEEVHPDIEDMCPRCHVQLLWRIETINRAVDYTTISVWDMPGAEPWTSLEVRTAIGKITKPESCIS